jgi:uncharacterized protein (DUF488 family)
MARRPAIHTIGHSTRPLAELVALLAAHGVRRLVDVRTVPRSRHNPQFNREALPAELARAAIAYVHMPGLGGLRRPAKDSTNTAWRSAGFRGFADYMQTESFAQNLDALLAQAATEPVAIMCAEAVPWRCHRSLISDALTARGVPVAHIMTATRADPHAVTSFARIDGTQVTYPASGSPAGQGTLPLGDVGVSPDRRRARTRAERGRPATRLRARGRVRRPDGD